MEKNEKDFIDGLKPDKNYYIKRLFDRVVNNPITTIIGIILLIFCMVGVIIKLITIDQFIIIIPTILGLFYVKDSVLTI